ncbi:MAG: hypothetical protein FWG57_08500 [Endomicrobia bacterium]|nr:hypothetical protein [Endomicrobiia bacterium]
MKKLNRLFVLLLCAGLLLNSCSTKLISPDRLSLEKIPILQEYDYTKFDHKQFLEEIKALNKILSEKNIPESKYEDILNRLELLGRQMKIFESIKFNRKEASFTIPAKSRTALNFKSYCLNGGRGCPAEKEQFVLRKKSPDIPLYKDIMIYTNSGQEIKTVNKQHLLWNLKNNVKFENLPSDQQAFLLKMDPMSYLKVNNFITSEVKSQLTEFAKTQVPFYNQVTDTIKLVQGKAHTYEEYAKNIENIAVKAKLIDNAAPIQSDGYDIFTQTQSSGYSNTKIIFININQHPIAIDCTAFLDPFRPVQPIGFDFPKFFEEHEKYEDEILSELDKLLISLYKKISKLLGRDNEGDFKTIEENIKDKTSLFHFLADAVVAEYSTWINFFRSDNSDESDAFRHALWSALLTRDIGEKLAEEFTTNHETMPHSEPTTKMDLHNNKIGREIGKRLSESGITSYNRYKEEILKNKDSLEVYIPTGKWPK